MYLTILLWNMYRFSESHQWKTKMCGAKGSGNPRSKRLQATTHTRVKTMTQNTSQA